jgi:hypothetical protein
VSSQGLVWLNAKHSSYRKVNHAAAISARFIVDDPIANGALNAAEIHFGEMVANFDRIIVSGIDLRDKHGVCHGFWIAAVALKAMVRFGFSKSGRDFAF